MTEEISPATLWRLYWTEEKSLGEVAAVLGVHKSLLRRRLKAYRIPARPLGRPKRKRPEPEPRFNDGTPLAGTKCPFSPGRLRELYWDERRSQQQIAVLAAAHTGREKPFHRETVWHWFQRCGIPVRPRGHDFGERLRVLWSDPAWRERQLARYHQRSYAYLHTPEVRRKRLQALLRQKRRRKAA